MLRRVALILIISLVSTGISAFSKDDIQARALLKNMAVLDLGGTRHTLRVGESTPDGLKLISANTREAVLEYEGRRIHVQLSRQVGGVPEPTPAKAVVRIARGVGGHYFANGRINGKPVQFLVDTGATSLVMNALMAKKLRVDTAIGTEVMIQTASGNAKGYRVMLPSVAVGTLKLSNVEAIVSDGAFPSEILLGNSYLSRVNFKVDNGVLVLEAKY